MIDNLDDTLLVVTENGYGKRTPIREYKIQHRYGSGIRTLSKDLHKTGPIIGASLVSPDDGLTLITAGGIALRTEVNSISTYGRATSGVQLIHLAENDVLVGIAIVTGEEAARRKAQEAQAAMDGNGVYNVEDEAALAEDEALIEAELASERLAAQLDSALEDDLDDDLGLDDELPEDDEY